MAEARVMRVGEGRAPVMVVDAVTGAVPAIVEVAAAMAPFPPMRGNAYPGLRRFIAPGDAAAADYARRLLGAIAGAVNAVFGFSGFDLIDASFSMVTHRPEALAPAQRVPHFDSTDPAHVAVMHYLGGVEGSGTAFYRQRATGIERVDDANVARFVAAADEAGARAAGYIDAGGEAWERIGAVEGVADRLVAYQGSLLHSGTIPADMAFSDDPRRGRLTANFFVRGRVK